MPFPPARSDVGRRPAAEPPTSRPVTPHMRALRNVPLVLCTAVTTSILTWSVAVPLSNGAAAIRLGSALVMGANYSTTVTVATAKATKEEDHRKAVIDRLYSGNDAADHLGSLRLLDPEVSERPSHRCHPL